jgi:hypothetical protein
MCLFFVWVLESKCLGINERVLRNRANRAASSSQCARITYRLFIHEIIGSAG